MTSWSPESWQTRKALQQPRYDDAVALEAAVSQLAALPPLVTSWEIESLKNQLHDAALGRRFLLQGGDCAEQFSDCDSSSITATLKVLLQMSLVLVHRSRKRVIRVGRFAGQYAKPRSADEETRDGVTLPSYRGDLVNRPEFSDAARRPDPELLLRGYEHAAMTLNFVRALIDGGFADLHHPEFWDLGWVEHSPSAEEYQDVVRSIGESLRFMETLAGVSAGEISRVDYFASHEGLHLLYEQAKTRQVPRREGWYNLSTHLPWIGMRTAEPDGAHVEYFRGIRNPVAVKIGPGMTRDWLLQLLDILHPDDEPGRLTLIHRYGADRIRDELPAMIEAVKSSGKTVVWCCDPMHGNTESSASGKKTRRMENIGSEVMDAFDIHNAAGSVLGGVHVEVTGKNVTECTGGARGLTDDDLSRDYQSQVDPRLNYDQAMELALLIGRRMASD